MSLDLSLVIPTGSPDPDYAFVELWDRNITHNLTDMAREAGCYLEMWHPEEIAAVRDPGRDPEKSAPAPYARDMLPGLTRALNLLRYDVARLERFNPANGWGDLDSLRAFVVDYIVACRRYPDAIVRASR
jgi:hypothetical protein